MGRARRLSHRAGRARPVHNAGQEADLEFITVNDLTFHARFRDGPGPTLVFSNSLGTDFRIWNGVIAASGHVFMCGPLSVE